MRYLNDPVIRLILVVASWLGAIRLVADGGTLTWMGAWPVGFLFVAHVVVPVEIMREDGVSYPVAFVRAIVHGY